MRSQSHNRLIRIAQWAAIGTGVLGATLVVDGSGILTRWWSFSTTDAMASGGLIVAATGLILAALWRTERAIRAQHTELTEQREHLRAILSSSPVGMLLMDEERMIVDANNVVAQMVSRKEDQIVGQRGGGGLGCRHSREHEKGCGYAASCAKCPLRRALEEALKEKKSVRNVEMQVDLMIDGRAARPWLSISAEPVHLGGKRHLVVTVNDITPQKAMEEELQERTGRLQAINVELESQQIILASQTRQIRALLDGMPGESFLKDRDGRYLAANQMFCRAIGKPEERIIGATDADLFPPEVARRKAWEDQQIFEAKTPMLETEELVVQGERRQWMLTRKLPVVGEGGKVSRLVGIRIDITSRKLMEENLRAAATTDRLTGLPNRAWFSDRLEQVIARARRDAGYRFAVLFIDCDRFKAINDTLGHEAGDELLREVARRVTAVLRAVNSDGPGERHDSVARLGGDEFVVLLEGLAAPADAETVAARLLKTLGQPYRLSGHEVTSKASIGVVTSDLSGASAREVLRDADMAMYEAKMAGKGRYVLFNTAMRQRLQRRLDLERDLRTAVEGRELFLAYQPIVSLRTGDIEYFEALLRWRHEQRGFVPTDEFLEIAEESGLMREVGAWAIREACRQYMNWCRRMGEEAPRGISVNLSRRQLLSPDLPEEVAAILKETGMPAKRLHLEVAECAVMANAAAAATVLSALRKVGVKLAIDNFGKSYSSLTCLHQLPIDELKIDRSFVGHMNHGRDYAALVHAMVTLARNLNIRVVAEGIENAEQMAVLQSLDCEYGQGYLFSPPVAAHEVPGMRISRSLPGVESLHRTVVGCGTR